MLIANCWMQVKFNQGVYSLLRDIIPSSGSAQWVQGYSVAGPRQEFPEQVSLLFTSPPYLGLEVYTTKGDPEGIQAADLSRQPVAEFRNRYKSMLCLWGALVKDGGWAVFRVGDVSTKEVSCSLLAAHRLLTLSKPVGGGERAVHPVHTFSIDTYLPWVNPISMQAHPPRV